MKKLFMLLVCAVLSIGARAQFSGSGNGTEADPYRIYTDVHLAQMANLLNKEGVVFELMKDIDLSSYIMENSPLQGWMPIGVSSSPFKGVFKGNNHTISGLKINRTGVNNIGLFGCIEAATIENLKLNVTTILGNTYVAALCGESRGNSTIRNVTVSISGWLKASSLLGGVLGSANGGTITDITVNGYLETSGSSTGTVGGVGGMLANAKVSNCKYEGEIKGAAKYAGGMIGIIENSTLSNSIARSKVTGSQYVGGLFGSIRGTSSISDCSSIGDVTGSQHVGGLCGSARGQNTIKDCSSTGDIIGELNISGGFGLLEDASSNTFTNIRHKGKINNSGDYTGGIVGVSNGGCIAGMESCSHFGDINGKDYVGGLVGGINTKNITDAEHIYISTSGTKNTKSATALTDNFISGADELIVNNCTAIGNITGCSYIGGLIGWDEKSLGCSNWGTGGPSYISLLISGNTYGYLWYGDSFTGERKWTYEVGTVYFSPNFRISTTAYTNSYYSGVINGTDNVGGIAGYKWCGRIQNCYTNATIYGSKNVGGIIGHAQGHSKSTLTLKSNIAVNNTISATASNVGRIYGQNAGNVTTGDIGSPEGNRALILTNVVLTGLAQDVVDNGQNGMGIGLTMLKLRGNYVSMGWNFDKDWEILDTESYPYKKFQAAPPIIRSTLESHDTSISGQSLNGGTVYMYYQEREPVSVACNGNDWVFDTDALQSGAQVQLYADVDGMTPSYFTTATVKYPGSGTEEDPWRIYTAEDLQNAVNSGYYKVMNNINLTSWINENSPVKGWPSIGRNNSLPTYIDGDGHKISGLWIDTDENYNGLFSNYSAGYIKNLNVEVAEGKKIKGGDYTGILIGRMSNGQIINCSVKGEVEARDYTGGLTGYAINSVITNSNCAGTIAGTGQHAGGLVGMSHTVELANSNFIGDLSSDGKYVGGLTSKAEDTKITLCSASGTINSTRSDGLAVGGLVASVDGSSFIKKSFTNINITANSEGNCNCGGLAGYNEVEITESYSQGNVVSLGDNTGGLVGYNKGKVSNCYSTANVKGSLYTAGLVGYSFGTIDKCYANGNVNGVRYGAGLVGELDGISATATNNIAANNIVNLTDQSAWGCRVIGGYKNDAAEPTLRSNYALNTMQVSLNNVPQKKTDDNIEGVAKTATELMSASTYKSLGWDMNNVWAIEEGKGYPTLQQSAEVPVFPDDDDTGSGDGGENVDAPSDNILATDISKIDNVVYVEKQTVRAGNDFKLPLSLKSSKEEIVGFQCDIYLPSCVRLEKNSRGNVKAPTFNEESDRTSLEFHTISAATQADGAVRVLCYSNENEVILGTDGVVCDFLATMAEDAAAGEYAIKLKNITLTTAASVKYTVSEVTCVLSIPSYTKGDANGDDEIDVADISTTANHILGNESDAFVKEAADIDEDDVIDVADIAGIANIILYGDNTANKVRAKVIAKAAQGTPVLGVNSFAVESGAETAAPTLNLKNPGDEFCGFQCDIVFPNGIGWAKNSRGKLSAPTFNAEADRTSSEFHTVSAAAQADGSVRILCYSTENEVFMGEDGAILNLPLTFDAGLADGIYEVTIKNIVLSRPTLPKVTLDDYTFTVTVGNAASDFVMKDGDIYAAATAQTYDTFTYTRKFGTTNWQSLYLPVSVPVSTLAEQGLRVAYINNFNQYDTDGDDEPDQLTMEVFYLNKGALLPNTPYMVRAVTAGDKTIVVENADVQAADEAIISCSSMTYAYDVTGNYHKIPASELIAGGCYIVSGGSLKQLAANSTATLGAERWYLKITPRGNMYTNLPNEIKIQVMGESDDQADGIYAIETDNGTALPNIFDLSGRKVTKTQKGIYIVNGQKVLIK